MKLWVLAVGQRMPAWAEAAWHDYAKRFPPDLRLELKEIKAQSRTGHTAASCLQAEATRLEDALPKGCRVVVLDEHGQGLDTRAMATRLRAWRGEGRDVALLIGGPDGLHARIKQLADETWRLSDLTLPHAFVRVMLSEALYRAWTLTTGHPYHRE
ncbi:MAG: 23S rRNA (pseudouridine(1915)-N(3))-methyltransferase RlmH [Betaproteobacteria bacterium]|nr:23S rRNA (pseudouridine(1915)-N(3))-methyltransferase RlmH [Betaproteobacteria bacterium]